MLSGTVSSSNTTASTIAAVGLGLLPVVFHVYYANVNAGTTRQRSRTLPFIDEYLVATSPVGTTVTKEDCALGLRLIDHYKSH